MPNGQYRALDEEQQRTLARIEEDADVAGRAFDRFREQQTALGGEVTQQDKKDLGDRLRSLADELDRLLAAEYGVDLKKAVPIRRLAQRPPALPLVRRVLRHHG